MKEYFLRSATGQDDDAINDLYFEITGRRRTPEQYGWEWKETPEGAGQRWVICHRDSGRIVGHHGLIPVRMNVYGKSFLAGKTENTMVAQEHRKKLFYPPYEKEALQEATKKFDVFFTTAGRGAPGLMRRRLGYHSIGQWITYVLSASPGYLRDRYSSRSAGFPRPILKGMVGLLSRLYLGGRRFFFRNVSGMRVDRVDEFMECSHRLEAFWTENRRYFGLTPERSKPFLDWRFGRNPYCKYLCFLFSEGGNLVGFIIARESVIGKTEKKYIRLVIEDAVGREDSVDLYGAFFRTLWDQFAEYDLVTFRTLHLQNGLNRVLDRLHLYPWRSGGEQAAQNSPFYVFCSQPYLEAKPWFVTEILTEGVG